MAQNALQPHILVVDDDDRLRDLLRMFLAEEGFLVTVAEDAASAEKKLQSLAFDLVVLDIMMPGETGLEFAASLKQNPTFSNLPILLLTAMGEPEDRISGLETGADDYLTKPFEPRELLLRMRAILRRVRETQTPPKQSEIRFGAFRFDIANQRLWQADAQVHLTSQEQYILVQLAEQAGKPVSREALMQTEGTDRSVDVQINRLRKKMEANPSKPVYLQTARGAGYVWRVD